MSAEVITMAEWRRSQMLTKGGDSEINLMQDLAKAQTLFYRHLRRCSKDCEDAGVSLHALGLAVFHEALIALYSNGWSPEDIKSRIDILIEDGWFEGLDDDEEDDD